MARGIAYLHERNIVHGDLKPVSQRTLSKSTVPQFLQSNVIISAHRDPMITDFGILPLLEGTATTMSYTRADDGSVRWCAPEVIQDSGTNTAFTKEADIWSLGMIYYVSSSRPYAYYSE